MARARNIKPGFFENDDLAQCEYGARLMFVGLWTLADREGRLEDRPVRIKGQLFPYDNCDCESWLTQLTERGFITRYQVANCKYIQINNFSKHQNPHIKEQASTIPAPGLHHARTEVAGLIPDSGYPLTDSGLLIPDSGSPQTDSTANAVRVDEAKQPTAQPKTYSQAFEEWWSVYPRRTAKQAASAAYGRAISRIATSRSLSRAEAAAWLLDVTEQFKNSPAGNAGEYVPYPASWLNDGRFDDDRQEWHRKRGGQLSSDPRGNLAQRELALQSLESEGEDG